jgi:integrase
MAKKKRRDSGTGSVYQRGEIWWIAYRHRGKQRHESAKSTLKTVAIELLKQRLGEIHNGIGPGTRYEKVTFQVLKELLVTDYKHRGQKRPRVSHLEAQFEDYLAMEITTTEIKKFIDKRKAEGAANATINQDLRALRRMFNLAKRETPPLVREAPYVELLPENNAKQGFFEDITFEAFRDALPSYLKAFVTFGYLTGWRREEVAGLTWDRIDMERKTIELRPEETKNKTARLMKMEAELSSLLEAQEANRNGCPYVFNREGEKIKDFRGPWNQACRKTKLGEGYKDKKYQARCKRDSVDPLPPGPTYHDLRRTAVRNMVRAGIKEEVAMKISGHKTRSVFERYNIIDDRDLEEAARKMEEHRNKAGDYNFDYNSENQASKELQAFMLFSMISGAWDENRTRTRHSLKGF